MVGLIDTHCHLYLEEYDDDRQKLVDEARASGIDTLLMPNVDLETVDRLFSLCDECPDFVYPMMGLHPTSVGPDYVEALGKIVQVDPYPAHKVYTVRGAREYLIPAVPEVFIKSVDLDADRMEVHVWEGMDGDEN